MSTQKTLTAAAPNQENELSEILEKDELVDELTDIQAIDAWVRGQFAHQILRGAGPEFMRTDRWEAIEQRLKEGTPAVLKEIALRQTGRNSDLSQALGWEDGPGNPRTLFNRWVKDDAENPIQAIKQQLKNGLRGCGMPRITIYRERVQYHANNPDALTEQ